MTSKRITDNLDALLDVLPQKITQKINDISRADDLLEVILDIGRIPTARYTDTEVILSDIEVNSLAGLRAFSAAGTGQH